MLPSNRRDRDDGPDQCVGAREILTDSLQAGMQEGAPKTHRGKR